MTNITLVPAGKISLSRGLAKVVGIRTQESEGELTPRKYRINCVYQKRCEMDGVKCANPRNFRYCSIEEIYRGVLKI